MKWSNVLPIVGGVLILGAFVVAGIWGLTKMAKEIEQKKTQTGHAICVDPSGKMPMIRFPFEGEPYIDDGWAILYDTEMEKVVKTNLPCAIFYDRVQE